MARRNAFKSNASFFQKLAVGALGAQAVRDRLTARGHRIIELERGSLSTRIWRDVKRKGVRIPDLCCSACGTRVESRAKSKPELSMSHSPSEAERAWDFGMTDADWVAFPVLSAREDEWTSGLLAGQRSLWRERTAIEWRPEGEVNLFTVAAFRAVKPQQLRAKGREEGSEVQVRWKGHFAPAPGQLMAIKNGARTTIIYLLDGATEARSWRLAPTESPVVTAGDRFERNQVVACEVAPLSADALGCRGGCGQPEVHRMLESAERTMRFTGCKLARAGRQGDLAAKIRELADDGEEDPYVRLEARSFLCEVAGDGADAQFAQTILAATDEQMRLEAAVSLAETRTPSSFDLLKRVLQDTQQPAFLRSACAWAIGCHGTQQAAECLVQAFSDLLPRIREEAVVALTEIGSNSIAPLMKGLAGASADVAAGAAEVLRRIPNVPAKDVAALAAPGKTWPTWALAHLPRTAAAPHIAALQNTRPDVHYAVSVIWSFLDSWIASDWTPKTTP